MQHLNRNPIEQRGDAYAFGLWCADGYWWSSSVGISNTEPYIVLTFAGYLSRLIPADRLRLRVYVADGSQPDNRILNLVVEPSLRPPSKMKRTTYHLYVNSRPVLRAFLAEKQALARLGEDKVGAYFAGRFDGDGCWGSTPRIAYSTHEEAIVDQALLCKVGLGQTSVYRYAKANQFCLYIKKSGWSNFRKLIGSHSWKLNRGESRRRGLFQ